MEKFFSRLTSEKVTCSIFLCVHNVEAKVSQPLKEVTLHFTRGPQKDESYKFKVTPEQALVDISQTFRRDSNFYAAKHGGYQPKLCQLAIGFYPTPKDKWQQLGSITVDMGQWVNLPQVRQWFSLECSHKAISMARIDCTFMVYDINGPGPVLELQMPDDDEDE